MSCVYGANKKAQTIAIRRPGSPQATILYGKVCAVLVQFPTRIGIALMRFEVVIRTTIELRYVE